ncbi:Structural maintenance of chromosomes protein 3, partial [Vitis vinifera]
MGDSRLTVNMRRFDEFIRESGLLDPPLRNAAFTWSNMQVDPICKRLDRFLFSSEWDSFFSQNIQEALPRWTSDHSPICLETNPFMWGPTPFRFENMWLLHPEFKEKFRDWWQECTVEGWEGHKFMRKLKFIKSKLKEWNTRVFGDLRERKKHILTDLGRIDRIEQEGNLNLELVSERILRRKELEDLLLKEEVQWRQKSRVKWIKEGDCNSKFFHRVATGRRSRKFIKSLISERGETLNNIEVISEEIVNFFGNLYSKPEGDSWKIEGIDWAPISEESAIWLDRPFSEEEVRMAVFQLNREKAPGPDGFTLAVYQECWDVIKEDLMRVFFEFHTKGVINRSTNATFIAMVPKKSQTFKISDYRPISLVTSLYKIIAKVLSGRLRKVLHETIFGSQGAFVEGRQILDAVLIANEVVDEKRRSGEEGVVFKIDFEKAYDHVEWGFLDHVLQRKGFSQKWRSWMRGCLSSSSFAILVNGNAKGWVKASRGLRQGDPLSSFLFTLVADVLSRLMIRAEETGITEASLDLLQNLKIILMVFGQVSGLKINLEKSTISGLPLGGNPKTIGFWDPVVERISRRLDGWKNAYLSLGRRITLIQSCLSHIPSYFLSLFKILVSIASKIEKMQRDFLWSGAGERKRDHLIRWEVVSRPREMGGLGFGKTSMRNSALLGKWLWRFPRERSGLWHKVIASIYGTHPNGWDANMVVRWSHRCPWKAIAQVFQEFSPFVRLVVGNGERIRFWEDLWWGNQTLCAQFAELYRVISVRNLTVSNVLGNSFPLSWNFNFRRNLTDSEIDLLQRLMSSLHSVLLSPSSSDSRAWSLSSSGSFSVKSFFYALSRDSNPLMFLPAKFLWSSKVPSKVKALAWLVAHGKVNTNDKLQLRRPYKALCPQWCILCKGNGESIDHLFLHCPITIGLWHRLFNLVGVIWVPPRSIEDMLVISFKGLGNSVRGKILWQIACLTLIWMVWQERNNRIFEDKGRTEEVVWDLIRFYSSLWASCTEAFRGVPLSILQINWIGFAFQEFELFHIGGCLWQPAFSSIGLFYVFSGLLGAVGDNQQSESDIHEKKLQDEIHQLNAEVKERDIYIDSRKKEIELLQSLISQSRDGFNDYKAQRDKLQDERKSLWGKESELSAEIDKLKTEVVKAEKSLDHATPGDIRRGLNSVRRICREFEIHGVFGPIFELLDCDEKFFTAVEVTAGNSLFHVVVETDEVSTQIIRHLNALKGGRVTFIPLNRVKAPHVAYPQSSDVIPLLKKLKFSPNYTPAFAQVFARTVICRDLDVATRVARTDGLDCITLEGDQVSKKGGMTGGFYDYRRSKLKFMNIIRQNSKSINMKEDELEKVRFKLQDILYANEFHIDQKITELVTEQQKIDAKQAHDRSELEQLKQDILNANKQKESIYKALQKKEKLLADVRTQIEQLKASMAMKQAEMGTDLIDHLTPEEKDLLSRLNPEITDLKDQLIT